MSNKYFFKTCLMMVLSIGLIGCADLKIGKAAYTAGDYQTARDHYAKLSEYGIPEAEVAYAQMLARGQGGPADPMRARQLMASAAEHDYTRNYYDLGKMYQTGVGGPVDAAQARYYYNASLAAGEYRSAYQLGRMAEDDGDLVKAAHYYEMAYDGRYYSAAQRMGFLYEKKTQPVNLKNALAWYYVAQKRDVPRSDDAVKRAGRKLSPQHMKQARQMAEILYEKK